MTHQVQYNIPIFEAVSRKNMHLFLERRRRSNNVRLRTLTQSDCLFLPCSLNTTTTFYFVTECSDIAVFVRLRVCMSHCHNALVLYLGLTSLGISVPLCSSVVPSEQIVLIMRL